MDEKMARQLETNKKLIQQHDPKHIMHEDKFRSELLNLARMQGCENELKQILNKYDSLIRGCTNPIEKKDIALNGIAEIHRLLNVSGGLSVDGVEILPQTRSLIE